MAVVRIKWVEDEETQHALAELVRLLAREAARRHHERTRDSRTLEGVKQ
jgi:hypothetical protein